MSIEVQGVRRRFATGGGVDDLHLSVGEGELVALLGPSGCGKTTALRIIAGLTPPEAGRVLINGQDVTALPPERRSIGLVFQSYALFPHLSAQDNVAYGLKARRLPKAEIRERVAAALDLVGLAGAAARRPDELSGGEQQRIALARALVTRPSVLLLDEPLSNLDAALRRQMRQSLREIQKRSGVPAVHVTHDQEEALAVADRIGVMARGRVVQFGTPEEVYQQPESAFVARFLGGANIVPATMVEERDGRCVVEAFLGARVEALASRGARGLGRVVLAIRPDAIQVVPAGRPGDGASVPARVISRAYLGSETELLLDADGATLLARLRSARPESHAAEGAVVGLRFDPAQVRVVPAGEPEPEAEA